LETDFRREREEIKSLVRFDVEVGGDGKVGDKGPDGCLE